MFPYQTQFSLKSPLQKAPTQSNYPLRTFLNNNPYLRSPSKMLNYSSSSSSSYSEDKNEKSPKIIEKYDYFDNKQEKIDYKPIFNIENQSNSSQSVPSNPISEENPSKQRNIFQKAYIIGLEALKPQLFSPINKPNPTKQPHTPLKKQETPLKAEELSYKTPILKENTPKQTTKLIKLDPILPLDFNLSKRTNKTPITTQKIIETPLKPLKGFQDQENYPINPKPLIPILPINLITPIIPLQKSEKTAFFIADRINLIGKQKNLYTSTLQSENPLNSSLTPIRNPLKFKN